MAGSKLKIDIRRRKILEYLKRDGKVVVSRLSQDLGATPVTIRNDLDALERDGYLVRMQGGAIQANCGRKESGMISAAVPGGCQKEKWEIARAVAGLVRDGDTLFLNSGTTTGAVALALRERENLNIVTNSIAVALELGKVPSFRVLLLGGEINAQYGFTCGGDAQDHLRRYQADWAILSVDGISVQGGITTYHAEEAIVNRMMIERAEQTIVAADHSKIGRPGFTQVCGIASIPYLVTDSQCSVSAQEELKKAGLTVIIGEEVPV